MKYSYNELKAMLETATVELRKEIIATLAQSNRPMSAKELAKTLDCSEGTITNWLGQNMGRDGRSIAGGGTHHGKEVLYFLSDVADLARPLGLKVCGEQKNFYTTYVNPADPSDTIEVKRKHFVYWIESLTPEDCN